MSKKILTFAESKTSPHRSHVITQAEAENLAKYFNDLDELSGKNTAIPVDKVSYTFYLTMSDNESKNVIPIWKAQDFAGKTILDAGTFMDFNSGFAEECIQHIICNIFNYDGQY